MFYESLCPLVENFVPEKKEFIKNGLYLSFEDIVYEELDDQVIKKPKYFMLPNAITVIDTDLYCMIFKDDDPSNVGTDCKRFFLSCTPMIERSTNTHKGVFLLSYGDINAVTEEKEKFHVSGCHRFMVIHKDLGFQGRVLKEILDEDSAGASNNLMYTILHAMGLIERLEKTFINLNQGTGQ